MELYNQITSWYMYKKMFSSKCLFQHECIYLGGCWLYLIFRTDMLKCSSDAEFLAKLYSVRLAFGEILVKESIQCWFADSGREIITNLLVHGGKVIFFKGIPSGKNLCPMSHFRTNINYFYILSFVNVHRVMQPKTQK